MAEPLSRKDLKYVFEFRRRRDIYEAARAANIPKNQAKRVHNRIEIQEEIERQEAIVDQERARKQVEAEGITKAFLDTRLLQLINLDEKKHPATVKGALELGYVRAGVLQVGNTKSLDLAPPNPDDETFTPTVYQALFTVGVTTHATPILPETEEPRAPDPVIRERIKELTTPIIRPDGGVVVPSKPSEAPVRAGRMKTW